MRNAITPRRTTAYAAAAAKTARKSSREARMRSRLVRRRSIARAARVQPILAMRFCISSGGTSSTCCASVQVYPSGSWKRPERSP